MHAYTEIIIASFAFVTAVSALCLIRKYKREDTEADEFEVPSEPDIGSLNTLYEDEIIAIRKKESAEKSKEDKPLQAIVISVMAKGGEEFVGYELLQALLSQGLKFGEMNIFHRHQHSNGKGLVLFSLASAVEPGIFDIKNMGKHRSPGLTLFMQLKGDRVFDGDAFSKMHQTALALARDLGGALVDGRRQLLDDKVVESYKNLINKAA